MLQSEITTEQGAVITVFENGTSVNRSGRMGRSFRLIVSLLALPESKLDIRLSEDELNELLLILETFRSL